LNKKDRGEWPYCVLIIDMVGDKDLEIARETYSAENASWLLKMIVESALCSPRAITFPTTRRLRRP